jgi:hypothetical protein
MSEKDRLKKLFDELGVKYEKMGETEIWIYNIGFIFDDNGKFIEIEGYE